MKMKNIKKHISRLTVLCIMALGLSGLGFAGESLSTYSIGSRHVDARNMHTYRGNTVDFDLTGNAAAGTYLFSDGEWSDWEYLTDEVSVSFLQVQGDTWTWRFRNDSDVTTITYLSFKYTDSEGEHGDVLPGSLSPRSVFGGWAAFTASSEPTITLKEVDRR
jgi:hypothetical protein